MEHIVPNEVMSDAYHGNRADDQLPKTETYAWMAIPSSLDTARQSRAMRCFSVIRE